ncbi:regulatory protein RecX [Paenibacillus sp. GCM10023252]|uniref:regulatory protein RecX n=1 Tax=Paenibacillus sp. GCM10023252 TaxID=3252649 RepID=UPI003614A33B
MNKELHNSESTDDSNTSYSITSVEQDRKERRRYHIYVDGAAEPMLSVHEDILIKFRLLKGQSFTSDELQHITKEDKRYRSYAMACTYLGLKSRTKKQIEQYLQRKEFEAEEISYTLERLERERIVDDEEYAKQFAAQRLRLGQKGRRWIKQELQQRGIDQGTAAEAANELDWEAELAAAEQAAEKKWRTLKGENFERRRKLMGFLMRRGFPGDITKEAIKKVAAGTIDDMEDDDDGQMLDN